MKDVLTVIFTWLALFVFAFVIGFGINLLVWGILLKILCWVLPLLGITTIGAWTVAFSWKLVIVVSIVIALLRAIFSPTVNVRKE